MAQPPVPSDQRIAYLEWQVSELTKDLQKLNGIATDMAVTKREMADVKSRMNWILGLLGTFTVSLLIAAATFAVNSAGTG